MDFLKFAIENKKVRTLFSIVEEDFEDVGFYVLEDRAKYNGFCIGDLVFVQKYQYASGKRGDNHIFLIVDSDLGYGKTVYYGMILSSNIKKITYRANKLIRKNYINNLKKDSIIKTDVIYKIFTKNI